VLDHITINTDEVVIQQFTYPLFIDLIRSIQSILRLINRSGDKTEIGR